MDDGAGGGRRLLARVSHREVVERSLHSGTIRLTYQAQDVDSGHDRPATQSSDESEITPAMIKAGILAMLDHDPEFYSRDEIVMGIWLAMSRARSEEGDASGLPRPSRE